MSQIAVKKRIGDKEWIGYVPIAKFNPEIHTRVDLSRPDWKTAAETAGKAGKWLGESAVTLGHELMAKTYESAANIASMGLKVVETPMVPVWGALGIDKRLSDVAQEAVGKGTEAFRKGGEPFTKKHPIAKGVGSFGGTMLGMAPYMMGAGGAAAAHPEAMAKLGTAGKFVGRSLGTTSLLTGTEGRFPTPTEAGGYMALDLALSGVAHAGKKMYQNVFNRAATTGQAKQMAQSYGQTPGQMAQKYGYAGSERSIKRKAMQGADDAWAALEQKAKTGKSISRNEYMKIKNKILEPMIEHLPNSAHKAQLVDDVTKVVEQFAPTKRIEARQIVEQIKHINASMWTTGGPNKLVLTPKQASTLENSLKKELKKLLPGGSDKLYTAYAQNKALTKIMDGELVKKTLGRSIMGFTGGGVIGGVSAISNEGDAMDVMKRAVIGGVMGSVLFNLPSTYMKTHGGKMLQRTPLPMKTAAFKGVSSFIGRRKEVDKILERQRRDLEELNREYEEQQLDKIRQLNPGDATPVPQPHPDDIPKKPTYPIGVTESDIAFYNNLDD
jgi:hypothetical protein